MSWHTVNILGMAYGNVHGASRIVIFAMLTEHCSITVIIRTVLHVSGQDFSILIDYLLGERPHWRRGLLRGHVGCLRAMIVVVYQGALPFASHLEQERLTSTKCQYECLCRQHAWRVSGIAGGWCLTEELVTCARRQLCYRWSHVIEFCEDTIGLRHQQSIASSSIATNIQRQWR